MQCKKEREREKWQIKEVLIKYLFSHQAEEIKKNGMEKIFILLLICRQLGWVKINICNEKALESRTDENFFIALLRSCNRLIFWDWDFYFKLVLLLHIIRQIIFRFMQIRPFNLSRNSARKLSLKSINLILIRRTIKTR